MEQLLPVPLWPDGSIKRSLTCAQLKERLYNNQWAWRNNRTDRADPKTGEKAIHYICVGVFVCSRDGCPWLLRPNIRGNDQVKQHGKIPH